MRSLKADQHRVDELEAGIASTLLRLSSMELRVTNKLTGTVMTRSQVDHLLRASYRLRALGETAASSGQTSDLVIEIAKNADRSILVLPASAAA